MTRRFGPINGAGVQIVEEQGDQQISPGAFGSTAHTGIYQKGPIGKMFRVASKTDAAKKIGGIIPESQAPDAAFDFFTESIGAGNFWAQRVTDGTEKKASLTALNRLDPQGSSIKFSAGNGGRWAGKKQFHIDEYDSVTATTVTFTNPPSSLQEDELVGGLIRFNALPGQSFEIISNTTAGVLTVASDQDMVGDLDGSLDTLFSVELVNDGLAMGVLVKDGLNNPTTEFGLEFYTIVNNLQTRVKNFDNLSLDPDAGNYFVNVINDDSDSEFFIQVEDLLQGAVLAGKRPANIFGVSETLTDTVLTAKIFDTVGSSAAGATASVQSFSEGSSVVSDTLTLTVTAQGARATETLTFGANPDDADEVVINGFTITFKTVVADAETEVLIGADAEESLENLVAFINGADADNQPLLYQTVFAEKSSASEMNLFAQNAGVAGNAITTTTSGGANVPTWGGATLTGGVDQTWSLSSDRMDFVSETVTTGVAFTAVNDFSAGFTIRDDTRDSTIEWNVADTFTINIRPLPVGDLVGGRLLPDASDTNIKFRIESNTATTITVRSDSTMTDDAATGDNFRVEFVQQLEAGYDGIAGITDADYITAYDVDTSPLKQLRGQNLGLIKLATPGVTSSPVQNAGLAFAGSQNWQYRVEIPANIVGEQAADDFVRNSVGLDDFGKVTWPSFAKVIDSNGNKKLITQTGAIHGEEARIASAFLGFHKAAAGEDAELTRIVELPDGLQNKQLDQEFLTPRGINIILKKNGNFVLWGDRSMSTDNAFRFVHKREYLSHIENVFLENFDFIIFALNNRGTEQQLISSFVSFFIPELAKSAIVGPDGGNANLQDAVQIKIDEEINTTVTRAQGDLNAEITLRIVDTVERFIIKVGQFGVTESVS